MSVVQLRQQPDFWSLWLDYQRRYRDMAAAVFANRDRSRPTVADAVEVGLMEYAIEAHDRMVAAAANENRKVAGS